MSHCKTSSKEDCKILLNLDHLLLLDGSSFTYPPSTMIFSHKTNLTVPFSQTHPGNLWPASSHLNREVEEYTALKICTQELPVAFKSAGRGLTESSHFGPRWQPPSHLKLQHQHIPAAEASCQPVFGEVKPELNTSPGTFPPGALRPPSNALGSC